MHICYWALGAGFFGIYWFNSIRLIAFWSRSPITVPDGWAILVLKIWISLNFKATLAVEDVEVCKVEI